MHEAVYYIALLWHVVLIVFLVGYAASAKTLLRRLLALDTVTPIFVGAVAIVALARREPAFLTVALVLGLIGFVQTVAVARHAIRQRHRGVTGE